MDCSTRTVGSHLFGKLDCRREAMKSRFQELTAVYQVVHLDCLNVLSRGYLGPGFKDSYVQVQAVYRMWRSNRFLDADTVQTAQLYVQIVSGL